MEVKSAERVTVEIDLPLTIWRLVGLRAGETISMEEAKRHTLQQRVEFRTYLLTLLDQLKSAVRSTLNGEIVEKGRLAKLELDPIHHRKLVECQQTKYGYSVRVTSTEPGGFVRVSPKTIIEILLRGLT